MLLAGEVQEIVIHSGLTLATIVLRPDAIFKGQRITNQRFRLKLSSQGDKATTGISDKNLEDKIRATEAKIGIPPGSGVSIALLYVLGIPTMHKFQMLCDECKLKQLRY